MKDRVLDEIEEKLAKIGAHITDLEDRKKALHTDTQKVNIQISQSIEHQRKCLNKREIALLREVENCSSYQNKELEKYQNELYRCKGAYNTILKLVQNCSEDDDATMMKIQMLMLPKYPDEKFLKPVIFKHDSKALEEATKSFGLIHMPHQVAQSTPTISSNISSTQQEVYNDKSLSDSDSDSTIPATHPKVSCSAPKQFHCCRKACPTAEEEEEAKNKLPNERQENVAKWLNTHGKNTCGNALYPSLGDDLQDFDVVENEPVAFASNSEVMATIDTGDCTSDIGSSFLDVDNLDTFEESVAPESNVDNACCMNEKCGSFADCALNGKCKENAMEKEEQSKKWKEGQEKRKHVSEAVNTEVGDKNKWIKKSKMESKKTGTKSVFENLNNLANLPQSYWLKNNKENVNKRNVTAQPDPIFSQKFALNQVGLSVYKKDNTTAHSILAPLQNLRISTANIKDNKTMDDFNNMTKWLKKSKTNNQTTVSNKEQDILQNDYLRTLLSNKTTKVAKKPRKFKDTPRDQELRKHYLKLREKSEARALDIEDIGNPPKSINKMDVPKKSVLDELNTIASYDKKRWLKSN